MEKLSKEASRLFTVRSGKRLLESEEKTLVASIRPSVIIWGENTEEQFPEDTIVNTDEHKVHNCAAVTQKFNMAAGIVFMRAKIDECRNDSEERLKWDRLLNSLISLQETIDEQQFKIALGLNLIPKELQDVVVIPSVNYKLLVHEIKGNG